MRRTARRLATSDPEAIRAILRRAVAADDRTQTELAEAAGVSQPNLSRMLNADRVDPRIGSVGRLLRALRLPWSALDG